MTKNLNKILVVDGSYMLHRSLHVDEIFRLKNSKGDRTGGVFQFIRMLNKEIRSAGDYFPIVVFDNGLAKRRVQLDPNYKHATDRMLQESVVLTQEELDNDYVTQYRKQRNALSLILPFFGIPCIKIAGWEGDDLMYILSKVSNESVILTDDRDMLQLLTEKCKVRRPMAEELWDLKSFLDENDFSEINDFIYCKALRGDGSDNIPGSCKGIGSAYMNELIKIVKIFENDPSLSYPTNVPEMKEFCEKHDIKYRKAYLNFDKERFSINKQLVDLNLVKMSPVVLDSIIATIDENSKQTDYFKACQELARYEIREISVDDLMLTVKLKLPFLWTKEEN